MDEYRLLEAAGLKAQRECASVYNETRFALLDVYKETRFALLDKALEERRENR